MQARIKEIHERVDYYKKNGTSGANYLKDIPYLLAELQEAQLKIKISDGNLIDVCGQLQQSQDRERVLREALTYIANSSVLSIGGRLEKIALTALKQEDKP